MKKSYEELIQNFTNLISDVSNLEENPPPAKTQIFDRELSGNKINGGMVTNFASVGIKDEATKQVLLIHDTGIVAEHAQIANLDIPVTVNSNLTVNGEIFAKKLTVDEITADIRIERTTPLTFTADNGKLHGKGLIWTGKDYTKQFVYQDPGKFFITEDLDLYKDKCYRINDNPVLTATSLGTNVVNSNLRTLGVINDLKTNGNLNFDNFIFYDSANNSLGIGTDEPKSLLNIKSEDADFIIDATNKDFSIGTFSATPLSLITDNVTRLKINGNGDITVKSKVIVEQRLNIGVSNTPNDVDLTTAGPVRFQDKKFEVGESSPVNGFYKQGDIVWNNNPRSTGYVGWVCVREGAPGEWRAFGNIQ